MPEAEAGDVRPATGRGPRRKRTFTIRDALVLIAATAFGLWLARIALDRLAPIVPSSLHRLGAGFEPILFSSSLAILALSLAPPHSLTPPG